MNGENATCFYRELYDMLNIVTPLVVDCGKLCDAACCKGDGEAGMYLFPGEENMYDENDKWMKIYDSDFIFNGKPVKIAICDGTCKREKRPLSCRIFPLFVNEKNELTIDFRAKGICPLAAAEIPFEQYNPRFIKAVRGVFEKLNNNPLTREYVKETLKIIDDYKKLNELFI